MTVANQEKYQGIRGKIVLLFDKLLDRFRESKAFVTDTLEKLIRVRSTSLCSYTYPSSLFIYGEEYETL